LKRFSWLWSDDERVLFLDVLFLINAVLMIVTNYTVLLFHLVFVMLGFQAFFLRFRGFAIRAAFWIAFTTLIVLRAVFEGITQPDEMIEIPLLSAIIVSTFVIAGRREQTRRELGIAYARLERANEAKSQFLASVSHELRTPMNAILGFTAALLAGIDGPLNDEQKASLGWVQRGGQDLLALINEILDLSKIEAGRLVMAPEEFDPRELVETVCAQHRSLAAQKGVAFTWRDDGAPPTVVLDRGRTRQILVNLCGNALKFTREGSVEVVVDGAAADRLRVSVRDTGPGVPVTSREAIFEEFHQVDASAPGTGLGLAISRRLARLMGGDISIDDAPGTGSIFTLSLPRDCRGETPAVEQATGAQPTGQLLMAVDDDPSVAPLLEKMLSGRGYRVAGVRNPDDAVADARRLKPSVITLDVVMPERDGRDVLRDLRADPETRDIPVIMLTVVDQADAPDGADAHIVKPVRLDPLLRTLADVVRTR
jgi:signal transduction histidine kinase/CheY-like chemotaxis protein